MFRCACVTRSAAAAMIVAAPVAAYAAQSSGARFRNQTLYSSEGVAPQRLLSSTAAAPGRRFSNVLKPIVVDAPPARQAPRRVVRSAVSPRALPLVTALPAAPAPKPPKRGAARGVLAFLAGIAGGAFWWRSQAGRRREALALVAHELKSPLSAIESYADLMIRDGGKGGRLAAGLDDIRRVKTVAGELRRMVSSMLDNSLVEEGRWELDLQPARLDEIVDEAARLYTPAAASAGVELRSLRARDIPHVRLDAARLRQVLHNLLSNALKFTPAGGRIEVSARADPQQGRLLCVVEDTGAGIDPARRGGLFRKHSLPGRPLRGEPGSGLGLYVCKAIVEAHGGALWHEPAAGGGSRLVFSLPLLGG